MNYTEFKKELFELIDKFEESQGSIVLKLEIETSTVKMVTTTDVTDRNMEIVLK